MVRDELARPAQPTGPIPQETVDETLLLLSWFRRHPDALRRTEPLERWVDAPTLRSLNRIYRS